MEQAEPQAAGTEPGIRGTWAQLTLESTVLAGTGLLLARIARDIPDVRLDAGIVFAIALALHGGGILRFARRCADFLDLECPHCAESFHGLPERLPRPFRTHCAHCGAHA